MQDRPRRRCRFAAAGLALTLTVLAALLWARLKLVTGLPKSAYADPDRPAASHPAR